MKIVSKEGAVRATHPRLTDVLVEEHELIKRGLIVLARMAAELRRDLAVHPEAVDGVLHFLRDYADKRHHAKEEDVLFPWLMAKGFSSESGPVARMQQEHEIGRDHVRHMIADARHIATEIDERREFIRHAEELCVFLWSHIHKENNVLYPMAEAIGDGTLSLWKPPSPEDERAETEFRMLIARLEMHAQSWPKDELAWPSGCC